MSRKNLSLLCVVAVAALLLSVIGTSHAASYDWDGTTNAWNSLHWLPGPTAGPTGPSSANIATINGGTVTFAGHDTFGNHTTPSSAVINLNGGTLASGGRFTTIWDLNMAGGTLLANGGANATYPAFQLAGTLSVTGTSASSISVGSGSNNMINVGGNGNSTLALNVADVTGNANADLTVANVLQNSPFGPSALIKTGPGTLYLSQGDNNTANTFTGPFTLAAGTLTVRASGWKDATGYGPFTQLSDTSIYLDSNNWHTLNNSHYTLNGNLGITSQNHTNRLRLATGNATLGSSLVANMEAGSYLYVDGTLDDGGNGYGITVAGGGGVVLGGANTYTGKTTILGGMLAAGSPFSNVGVAGPFGAPTGANATIDIHNGATLAYRGPQSGTPISTNRPIDLAGSGPGTWAISVNGNDTTFVFDGPISATATGPMTLALRLGDSGNGDRERVTVNGGIPNASDGSPLSLDVICRTQSGSDSYVTLNGVNTFTGSTRLEQTSGGSTGHFTLGAAGEMLFDIGASGVNNKIHAEGSNPWVVDLDGAFAFDLSGADTSPGNTWQIVDTSGGLLTANYGGTFSIAAFTADAGGDLWDLNSGGTNYQFSESTGALSVLAPTGGDDVPEPATMALLGLAVCGLGGYIRRRRTA